MSINVADKAKLEKIAVALIDKLREEQLPIWQAREVFRIASQKLDDEKLK